MLEPDPTAPVWEFEGCAPSGNARRLFRLPMSRILKHFEDTGNRNMFADAWFVPDVCDKPAATFEGLSRSGQEEAICYTGVPSGEFSSKNEEEIRKPNGCTFMVFLTNQLEVTKWRWCKEDPDRPGFPVDHEKRFGRRLWPQD